MFSQLQDDFKTCLLDTCGKLTSAGGEYSGPHLTAGYHLRAKEMLQ